MKTVHLIRHSKSSWSIDGLDDCDRPLKGRGIRDAHLVSQFFKMKLHVPMNLSGTLYCGKGATRPSYLLETWKYRRKI